MDSSMNTYDRDRKCKFTASRRILESDEDTIARGWKIGAVKKFYAFFRTKGRSIWEMDPDPTVAYDLMQGDGRTMLMELSVTDAAGRIPLERKERNFEDETPPPIREPPVADDPIDYYVEPVI